MSGILEKNEFTISVGNYHIADVELTNFQKAAFVSAVVADTVGGGELNDFLFEVAYAVNLVKEFSDFDVDLFELRELERNEDFTQLVAALESKFQLKSATYAHCQKAAAFYLSPAGLGVQLASQINRVADKFVETLERLAANAEKIKPEDLNTILDFQKKWETGENSNILDLQK